jgi:hypothetical protein
MALAVAALVGIAAGVVVGFTTGTPDDARGDNPPPSGATTPAASPNDPLGIGASLQNLKCNGKTILVVGVGETRGALTAAVSANPSGEVHYLETAKSCDTLYGAVKQADEPTYAAYLGPFDSLTEPCDLRMNIDHKNDVVTSLKQGVKIHVPCLCVLDPEKFPELAVGMVADTRDGIYIRALQRLLIEIDANKSHYISGVYNQRTANMIQPLQEINAIDSRLYYRVEEQTWLMLRDRGCQGLDF